MYALFLFFSLFFSRPEAVELEPIVFLEKMEHSGNYLLIDTRRVEKYCESRLPGAVWCGSRKMLRGKVKDADKHIDLFVYCSIGKTSKIATKQLIRMGFKNVYELKGGFPLWSELGFPMDAMPFHDGDICNDVLFTP